MHRLLCSWLSHSPYLKMPEKKLLAVALSEAGRGWRGRDDGGNVTNVQ
jgi:hypothetical protein